MKRKILLSGFLFFILSVLFSVPNFLDYYNKSGNWTSGRIGDGTLVIKERVELTRDLEIPVDVTIKLSGHGMLSTNGYKFSITGDPANPSELDPRMIYVRRVLLIINQLLLSD